MSREAFDKLLAVFGAFADDSAVEYENVRKKLNNFFRFNGLSEEHTDKVIDVVARKISEENLELDQNYQRYFFAVARNYLKDYWKSKENKIETFDDETPAKTPFVDPSETEREYERKFEEERNFKCLNKCLRELPKEQANLIEEYYADKEGRDNLTRRLGISITLLRVRVLRIKKQLGKCLENCLKTNEV